MQEKVGEKVSVIASFNRETGKTEPRKMRWQGRDYVFKKYAYQRKSRVGRDLIHTFYASTEGMDFKLNLNTDNLIWTLEEITDGSTT